MAYTDKYLKDPEYINWVKSGLALNITHEVLRPFVDKEITKLHQSIVKKLPPGVSCGGCSVNSGCPNGICDKIQREIENMHWYRIPSFTNTCTGRWSTEPWEIAKCYMPPFMVYRRSSASDADFSACINVIINCRHFLAFGTSNPNIKETDFSKSRDFRNRVMHASPQKVTENDMRENLDILIDILNKIKTPETEDKTKEAIAKIQKTIQMKINIGDAIEMGKNATKASADKREKDQEQVQRERMIANFEAGCRKALCRITEEHISKQKVNLSVAAFLSKIEILAVIKDLCSKHKEILFPEYGMHKDIREWDLFVYCFILEELELSEPLENAVYMFVQEVKMIRNNLLLDATGVTQDDLSESCDYLIDTDLNTEITDIFNKDSPDVDVVRSYNSLVSWWRQEEEYGNKQVSKKQVNETTQALKEFDRRLANLEKAVQNPEKREHVGENVTLQGANAARIIIDAESELRVRGCDEKTEEDLQEHITSPDNNNIERNEAFDHFLEQRNLLEVNPVKGSIILNVKCSSITNVIDFWDSCMDGRAVEALSKVRDYYRRYFKCDTLEFDVILTKKGVSRCVNKIVEGLSSRFDVLLDNGTYNVQEILKAKDIQPIPGLGKDSMVVDDGSDILVKSGKPSLSLHEETDIKTEEERTKEENQFKASKHVSKTAEVTYLSWSKDDPPSSRDCSDYEDDFEPLAEMESSITGPSAEVSNDGEAPGVEYNCPEESSESLDEESSKSLDKDKQTNKDEQVPDDEYNYSQDSYESLDEESSKSLDEEPTAEVRNDEQVPDDEFNCSEESSECLDEESPERPDEEVPTVDIRNRDQVPDDEYSYTEQGSEYLDEDKPTAKIRSKPYVSYGGQVPGRVPQTKHRHIDDGRKIKRETTDSGPHLCRSLSEPSPSKSRDVMFKNYIRGRQPYNFEIREENIKPIGELSEEKNPQMGVGSELRRFRSCVDIKLFDDYYVVSVNNKIIKYSLDSDRQLNQLTVPGAGRMCYIRRSSRIAVLHTPHGVICLETKPSLSVVYSIRASSIQYMSICHFDSFHRAVNERHGLPNPEHTFAATATSRLSESGLMDEYIYIIRPEYDRHQTNNCYNEHSTRQYIPGLFGICSVHAFLKEKELCVIVGCKDRVCCVSLADKSFKWTIHLNYSATDVQFSDPYVLVCVQDDCRLFFCDYKTGKIVIDNILNRDDKSGRHPHKLSVYKNNVLVKFYNDNYWSCVADLKSSTSALETSPGFSLRTTSISKPV